ncbi:hypothetical protein [Rhodoblastus sp.]|uniref:hypothetical protein n=1 Tax=Rhodoblastus sp. TaxID=1962975 RepID=UPI0025DF7891|nr:hypothetical protein [Rhodoblastus sp.]
MSEVLKSTGFELALIVDDAFDDVPIAADLAMDEEAWTIFMDDVSTDVDVVEEAFPEYHEKDANELRASDHFVRAMYGLRTKLRPDLWNTLFGGYERDRAADRDFLEKLAGRLSAAGLQVKTAGRNLPEDAHECSIIFADLFLGAAQQDFDVDKSIRRLGELMAGRENAPPAVVLMSRSPRLQDKKERFRDDAKMVGALFRVYRKQDLLEGSTVETVLERLATHHADAVRVAAFLAAWEAGLGGAASEFMKLMRRLDLSDYSKIREVLLDVEGQPLGSYMLDVFDRILQHEIEGHVPTISAAQELNAIDPAKYPAPYIAGSSDLQDLVARSLWQNAERLKVTGNTAGMPVSFGDVLVRRSSLDRAALPTVPEDLPDVLVVLTPACDLVRSPDKRRVLLVGGALKALENKTWRYKTKGVTTPIVQFANQPRMSIEWDLDDQRMLKRDELADLIRQEGPYSVGLRLRESNALELQQRMLSDMGRVGLLSKMPFTFPVEVLMFTTDGEGKPKALELPITTRDGGVCITGRDSDGNDLTRLVLTEPSVDEILSVIPKIEETQVHTRTKDTLKRLQASTSFRSLLQRGLEAPTATAKGTFKPLKVPAEKKEDEEKQTDEVVGLIARNPEWPLTLSTNEQKSGALIIILNDLEPHAVMIGDAAPVSEPVSVEAAGDVVP